MIVWEPYNFGCCELMFYDRKGNPFNGTQKKFIKLHKELCGFRNTRTNKIILINYYGEIVANGKISNAGQ